MRKLIVSCFIFLIGLSAPTLEAEIIAPGANSASPGNAQGPAPLRFYGSGGSRVQQVYSSNFFGPEAVNISSISFRPFSNGSSAFFGDTVTASDSIVQLSTSAFGDESSPMMLSTAFADNVGSDVQTVFSGALSLTTDFSPGAGGTSDFTYTLNFTSPFVYDPSLGNLLLDINIPSSATVGGSGLLGFVTFDTVNTLNDGIASIVDINNGDALSGQFSTAGAITSFETSAVPEPTSLMLVAGVIGLALTKRRRLS